MKQTHEKKDISNEPNLGLGDPRIETVFNHLRQAVWAAQEGFPELAKHLNAICYHFELVFVTVS